MRDFLRYWGHTAGAILMGLWLWLMVALASMALRSLMGRSHSVEDGAISAGLLAFMWIGIEWFGPKDRDV